MSSDHRHDKDARGHHGHHGGHDHHHDHAHGDHHHDSAELRHAGKKNLTFAIVLITGYMFAEVIGGILSGSLALIADAGHMLTDAASIGLALAAMHFAGRKASAKRTFGLHRLEILAALVNALTLWLIAAWVVVEAFHRLQEVPEVEGVLMLSVGTVGLFVNVLAAWILHRSAGHSLNVEGAFQHVIADLLGSVGVVVIHDIHVWTIAQGYDALAAHVLIDRDHPADQLEDVLRRLRKIASDDFGIQHITIQVEQSLDGCTEHHQVDYLQAREGPALA